MASAPDLAENSEYMTGELVPVSELSDSDCIFLEVHRNIVKVFRTRLNQDPLLDWKESMNITVNRPPGKLKREDYKNDKELFIRLLQFAYRLLKNFARSALQASGFTPENLPVGIRVEELAKFHCIEALLVQATMYYNSQTRLFTIPTGTNNLDILLSTIKTVFAVNMYPFIRFFVTEVSPREPDITQKEFWQCNSVLRSLLTTITIFNIDHLEITNNVVEGVRKTHIDALEKLVGPDRAAELIEGVDGMYTIRTALCQYVDDALDTGL